MINSKKYEEALEFATKKHQGQFRIGGLPYITHPVAVAKWLSDKGYDERYIVTGLFHDLLEDTDAKEEEIEAIGGKEVLEAVKLLTKYKGYNMDEYVANIRKNPIAKAVKTSDRIHNLICAVECDDDFKRRYILETIDYYLDLDEEIPKLLKRLSKSMENPIATD